MGRLISDRCILDLVEHIYAAGCDPGEWKSVATRVQGAIPDTAFNVLMSVKGTELAANSTSVGIAEEHLKSYFEHYQFINPYNQFFAKLPVGQITTIGTMFEQRWVKAQPFYHEWLKPAGGFTHGAGCCGSQSIFRNILAMSRSRLHGFLTGCDLTSCVLSG
jgi:hypothetical protein